MLPFETLSWDSVSRVVTHTQSQEATLQFKINSISNLYHFFIFIFAWFWCATTAHFAENEKENATKGWRKEWEREYWLAVRDWIVTCHLPLAKRWGQIFGFHKLNSFEEFSFDLCGMVRCGVVWRMGLIFVRLLSNPMNMYAFDWNILLFERWLKSFAKGRPRLHWIRLFRQSPISSSQNIRTHCVMPSH